MTITVATSHEAGLGADPAADLIGQIRAAVGQRPTDVALLMISAHYEDDVERIAFQVHQGLGARALIGVTCETVIAADEEFEHRPSVALWAAHMPGARCHAFHLSAEELAALKSDEAGETLPERIGVPVDAEPNFILFGEPYSINMVELLEAMELAWPGRPVVGGMASAGEERGQNRLIFEGQALREGAVGVAMWGKVRMDTIVSQGCRPIGQHAVITASERNIIRQLGGQPPTKFVKELLDSCSKDEQRLAQTRGLLVGRVINEHRKSFGQGDFLIRNPIGFDRESGAMAINDLVRTGQTIQFHVRDAQSATADLRNLLAQGSFERAAGALLFTCNGRGTRLFTEPNHDARAIRTVFDRPVAGCSCAGEIGPLAGRNYIHGHTASIAFFSPAS